MPEKSTQLQILDQVSSLTVSLATHIAGQADTDVMTKAMYKILVTGNGIPPLPEIVRQHSEWIKSRAIVQEELAALVNSSREHGEWIKAREAERYEEKTDKKLDKATSTSDAKTDRREAVDFKRQIWLVVITQFVGFVIIGLEIALHWK